MKFYDTSSLLLISKEELFSEKFIISSIVLQELEHIKTSYNKDQEVKAQARYVTRLLERYPDKYEVAVYKRHKGLLALLYDLPLTNDIKILLTAKKYKNTITFVTNDLCLKNLAKFFLNCPITSVEEKFDNYTGYKELYLNEKQIADLYSDLTKNNYKLLPNEYVIIYDKTTKEEIDKMCWTGTEYRRLKYGDFTSTYFGNIKPLKGDSYQFLLADSFLTNKLTLVKGRAGSGKTMLSLAFLLHQLETNRIDKIIIFCNTVATKGSARLGFYPGTRDEKLLDSQIGNLLASKLGDKLAVEQLIQKGQLILLPMSDIRGYDTSGMRAGIYISEAQNTDIDLMKLALQRVGEDSICIIDGDCKAQVDDSAFYGERNGMRRLSKVFRGSSLYGEVELKKIHRSAIAELADKM